MAKVKKSGICWPLWAVTAALLALTAAVYIRDGGPRPAEVGPLERAAIVREHTPLDMNAADAAELEALPGIGPVLAERILAWRAENGPFRGREDVLAVSGIGPAVYEAIEPYIGF